MKTDSEFVTRYHLQKGPDGIVWVSIQPLMEDIREALDRMRNIDLERLKTDDDQSQFGLQIVALQSVYQFLGSLVTEQQLKDLKAQQGVNPYDPENWH